MSASVQAAAGSPAGGSGGLRLGSMSLSQAVMQGVTHMGPAVTIIFIVQFNSSIAGITSPLAMLIAFVLVLSLGIGLGQLAKHLPSAGGYYTFVSRAVHPRAGFLSGWVLFVYDPIVTAPALAYMGFILQNTLKASYGVFIPWELWLGAGTVLVFVIQYLGIQVSARALVITGVIEMVIVLALAFNSMINPGPGGFNFNSFNPGNSVDLHGLFLGVVFSIFAFTGFESVAPLAEETADPKRNVPRAIIIALFIMAAFYTLSFWGMILGWGTDHFQSFITSTDNGPFVIAKRLWSGAWILILFAFINSVFAVSLACSQSGTRTIFGMARSGALPAALAKVHPTHKTPTNAIILQAVITIVLGYGLGLWIGADGEFFFTGLVITLGAVLVYLSGNLAVFLLYRGEQKAEFNLFLHVVIPVVSTIAVLVVLYYSVIPLPKAPVTYAPVVVVVWLVIGIGVVWSLSRTGREQWLVKAGQTIFEEGERADVVMRG